MPGPALQGNLDPTILFGSVETVRERTLRTLDRGAGGDAAGGYIFNLGHGILPEVPLEHAGAFIQAVKDYHEG